MDVRSFVEEVAIGSASKRVSAKVGLESFMSIIDGYKPVNRSGIDPYFSGEFECLAKGKVVTFYLDDAMPNEGVVYVNGDA